MDLHGSGVGIIENGASRLWLKDSCVGAGPQVRGGVNPSLVCFRSMHWLDASTRAAHLDPSMDVEKPRHANTQQHVSGPRTAYVLTAVGSVRPLINRLVRGLAAFSKRAKVRSGVTPVTSGSITSVGARAQ